MNNKEKGPYLQQIVPRFTNLPVKVRLTQERKERISVGELLTCKELDVFFLILSNREAILAWEFSKIGRVYLDVVPP